MTDETAPETIVTDAIPDAAIEGALSMEVYRLRSTRMRVPSPSLWNRSRSVRPS